MKIIYKERGETPLEALEKFRASDPNLAGEKLSYIGRLDPMAEGEMLILVGREENQRREEFLHSDKEYEATFLFGLSTDTGDLLGLVNCDTQFSSQDFAAKLEETIEKREIVSEQISQKLLTLEKQNYPWFSSKHVGGRALFDWFKLGKAKEIEDERPTREIKIYNAKFMSASESRSSSDSISAPELLNYIKTEIAKVSGDFRQTEILEKWQGSLENSTQNFPLMTFKLKVSTGTYIRGLTEEISALSGVPVLLFSLKRTAIINQ